MDYSLQTNMDLNLAIAAKCETEMQWEGKAVYMARKGTFVPFNPTASIDDLRDHVFPVLEKRNLWAVFIGHVSWGADERTKELLAPWPHLEFNEKRMCAAFAFHLLTMDARKLAIAALKALNGESVL